MSKDLFTELLTFFAFTHEWDITKSLEQQFNVACPGVGIEHVYVYETEKTKQAQQMCEDEIILCVAKYEKPFSHYICFTFHEKQCIASVISYNPSRNQLICSRKIITEPNPYRWKAIRPGTPHFQIVRQLEKSFIETLKQSPEFRLLDVTGELTTICV